MGVINLAEKYSSTIDKAFKIGKQTSAGAKAKYDFIGEKTLKVYSIDNMPMNNYNRTGSSNRFGDPTDIGDKVQEMTVTKDRSFTGIIDKANNTQQMKIKKAAEILRQQIDEVVNPELDTYNLHVWGNRAVLNGAIFNAVLTKDNVYEYFLKAQERLSNKKVPKRGRICYASAKGHNLLKRCNEYTKATEIAQKFLLEGQVGKVDDVPLFEVPEDYLPQGVAFIVIHPSCSVAPIQMTTYRILDEVQGIDGNVVEGHIVYDCFVLDKKKDAIATVGEGTPGLHATSVEGAVSGGTLLGYDLPGVLASEVTVKYKLDSSAITTPAVGSTVASYTAYTTQEIACSTNTHFMLVALDSAGKVLFAEGGKLVKKA